MATDNETMAETTTSEGTGSFPEAYIRLRTVLDALEIKALQYVLEDKNEATRTCRAGEIVARAMLFIEQTGDGLPPTFGGCGAGFHNCGGICVPYHCPLSSD